MNKMARLHIGDRIVEGPISPYFFLDGSPIIINEKGVDFIPYYYDEVTSMDMLSYPMDNRNVPYVLIRELSELENVSLKFVARSVLSNFAPTDYFDIKVVSMSKFFSLIRNSFENSDMIIINTFSNTANNKVLKGGFMGNNELTFDPAAVAKVVAEDLTKGKTSDGYLDDGENEAKKSQGEVLDDPSKEEFSLMAFIDPIIPVKSLYDNYTELKEDITSYVAKVNAYVDKLPTKEIKQAVIATASIAAIVYAKRWYDWKKLQNLGTSSLAFNTRTFRQAGLDISDFKTSDYSGIYQLMQKYGEETAVVAIDVNNRVFRSTTVNAVSFMVEVSTVDKERILNSFMSNSKKLIEAGFAEALEKILTMQSRLTEMTAPTVMNEVSSLRSKLQEYFRDLNLPHYLSLADLLTIEIAADKLG